MTRKQTKITKSYNLDIAKALKNKVEATKRNDISCTMTAGGLVIKMSTAYYEAFRQAAIVYMDTSNLLVTTSSSFDKTKKNPRTNLTEYIHEQCQAICDKYVSHKMQCIS